jgi:hypothetical protein
VGTSLSRVDSRRVAADIAKRRCCAEGRPFAERLNSFCLKFANELNCYTSNAGNSEAVGTEICNDLSEDPRRKLNRETVMLSRTLISGWAATPSLSHPYSSRLVRQLDGAACLWKALGGSRPMLEPVAVCPERRAAMCG